ncbi:hypothetical protein ACQY0O_007618 [Thecaphora frezii]
MDNSNNNNSNNNNNNNNSKGKARALDPAIAVASDPASASPLSYNQLIDALVDFLEVAFHTILCMRGVYPHDVFVRRKKYSHPCYQSRHPGLNQYIARILASVKQQVQDSKVDKVILTIRPNTLSWPTSPSSSPSASNQSYAYERFTFALDYILPSSQIDARDRNLALSHNVSQAELDILFRGFLQKLMVVDSTLYDIPITTDANTGGKGASQDQENEELTFAVVLEMKDDAAPTGNGKDQAAEGDWILAEDENLGRAAQREQRSRKRRESKLRLAQLGRCAPPSERGRSDEAVADSASDSDSSSDSERRWPKLRPIKTLDSGVINLFLYVEEDVYAKSHRHSGSDAPPSAGSKSPRKSAAASRLLSSKASQLLHTTTSAADAATAAASAHLGGKSLRNLAKRVDAERDLDLPPQADSQLVAAAVNGAKRKRARMMLGDTRAAESQSESSDGDASFSRSEVESDVDMR